MRFITMLKSLLTACFLLVFPLAAYCNVIMPPHRDPPESSILDTFSYIFDIFAVTWPLSGILLAGTLATAVFALIRVFWKPNKKRRRGAKKHTY